MRRTKYLHKYLHSLLPIFRTKNVNIEKYSAQYCVLLKLER